MMLKKYGGQQKEKILEFFGSKGSQNQDFFTISLSLLSAQL